MHDKNCGPDNDLDELTKEELIITENDILSTRIYKINTPVVNSPHLEPNPNEFVNHISKK